MPSTRSSSRSSSVKRKSEPEPSPKTKTKKARVTTETEPRLPLLPQVEEKLVPAALTFSFEEARAHLIRADPRFEDVFERVKCRPFLELEAYHPFHALASSILGQQISWKAARSIRHKFIRLFDTSIPESLEEYKNSGKSFFPTPYQVATTDIATLRTAGLSARKAEYIQDLATRFADGRLSTDKVMNSTDEELMDMLVAVKGIGRWTVEMFAIFSLRRPDILPVGDLGVQRGMLRWFLALHSSTYTYTLSPEKVAQTAAEKESQKSLTATVDSDEEEEDDVLPIGFPTSQTVDNASVHPPATTLDAEESAMPPTFTPSIKKTLAKRKQDSNFVPPSLPTGLTAAVLKSRLDGKKKIKGALLTPTEMEELTTSWQPYRSLAVYYMWALAEADA